MGLTNFFDLAPNQQQRLRRLVQMQGAPLRDNPDDEDSGMSAGRSLSRMDAPASSPGPMLQPTMRSMIPLQDVPDAPDVQAPLRLTRMDQLRRDVEDAQNQPLTFGTDKEGNTRYAPQKDFGHRVLAGLKTGGRYALDALKSSGGNPIAALEAGAIGLGEGAVDPTKPARIRRLDQIRSTEGAYGHGLAQAGEEAKINREQALATQEQTNAEQKPLTAQEALKERERDNISATYRQILASGQEFDPENPEHKQIHDRAAQLGLTLPYGQKEGKHGAERQPIFKTRKNADGSEDQLKSADNGETWQEIPTLKSAPPLAKPEPSMSPNEVYNANKDFNERIQKKKGLIDAADAANGEGANQLARRKAADERIAAINAQLKQMGTVDKDHPLFQERSRLQKDSEQAQSAADAAYREEKKNRAAAGMISDTAPPVASSRGRRTAGGRQMQTAPTTHNLSLGTWLKYHPGKTEADAKAAYPGYTIVP